MSSINKTAIDALALCATWIENITPEQLELWRDAKVAEIRRGLRALAPTVQEAEPAQGSVDWMMCERIAIEDHVDEALRVFSEDATLDNATGAIQAALTVYLADTAALAQRAAVAEVAKPVVRLHEYESDRPYSEGKKFFEMTVLDRSQCYDGIELYAAPSLPAAHLSFQEAWPEIHKAGEANGWLGIARAAWDAALKSVELDSGLQALTISQLKERLANAEAHIESLEAKNV